MLCHLIWNEQRSSCVSARKPSQSRRFIGRSRRASVYQQTNSNRFGALLPSHAVILKDGILDLQSSKSLCPFISARPNKFWSVGAIHHSFDRDMLHANTSPPQSERFHFESAASDMVHDHSTTRLKQAVHEVCGRDAPGHLFILHSGSVGQ